MISAAVLSIAVVAGLWRLLKPAKAKQTEYMRGLTDAQAMVEANGLKSTAEYFNSEFYGWDFETYEHGWQDFLRSLQAKLIDLDWQANTIMRSK